MEVGRGCERRMRDVEVRREEARHGGGVLLTQWRMRGCGGGRNMSCDGGVVEREDFATAGHERETKIGISVETVHAKATQDPWRKYFFKMLTFYW